MDNKSDFNEVLDAKNILHGNFLPYQYLMTNILKSKSNREISIKCESKIKQKLNSINLIHVNTEQPV